LPDIPGLRFSTAYWDWAKAAAAERRAEKALDSATKAAVLVAAARLSFDEDPSEYRSGDYGKAFKDHIQSIVVPGVRAGEGKLGEAEKQALSETARNVGEAWFEDFAAWAGVSRNEDS
jgi:hypothetical protein